MAYVSQSAVRNAFNKASTGMFQFTYKNAVKKYVFNQSPDDAHDQMIRFCQVSQKIPPLMWLLQQMLDYTDPVLETRVMDIDFHNPFGLSAGLDKNALKRSDRRLPARAQGIRVHGSTVCLSMRQ